MESSQAALEVEDWEVVTAFNTATGFKEWLQDGGVKTKKKRQEIVDRLIGGEVIAYGKASRMRFDLRGDYVGVFMIERNMKQ